MRPLVIVLLSGCAGEFGLRSTTEDPASTREDAGAGLDDAADEVAVRDTAGGADDSGAPSDDDGDAPPATPGCDPAAGWVSAAFAFPPDELSCGGPQAVRFDSTYGLYVGVVSCGGTSLRIYLSDSVSGPFLPALDWAGHGQDHCELIDPGFRIPNEDDITSGGCASCGTSVNLPLEGVEGWVRGTFGTPFAYVEESPFWSYQTSQLDCGVDLAACVP